MSTGEQEFKSMVSRNEVVVIIPDRVQFDLIDAKEYDLRRCRSKVDRRNALIKYINGQKVSVKFLYNIGA